MAQAALKNEVTTSPETARVPKFAAPEICHDVFEQTCITCARGASEWGAKPSPLPIWTAPQSVVEGGGWLEDPGQQLAGAARGVYRSWMSERAQTYRRLQKLEALQGTAVTGNPLSNSQKNEARARCTSV